MPKIIRDTPQTHLVVVDTNILWDKDKKNAVSPDFDRFWKDNSSLIPLELRIPEVVFGELHFQQTTSALKSCAAAREHMSELSGITQSRYVPKIDENKIREQVGRKIEKWAKGLGGIVVPTPCREIDWQGVIGNAMWRRPPFTFDAKNSDNEKGFRDALILETLVSISKANNDEDQTVIFLCNDYLLRTTAEQRLKQDKKFLAFESTPDFQSYIRLTQQTLTDKFVKGIQARARAKFYAATDENCLYEKEKLRAKILADYDADLSAVPDAADYIGNFKLSMLLNPLLAQTLTKSAEKWWIGATRFENLVGDREFHWVSTITVAQLFERSGQAAAGLRVEAIESASKIKLVAFDVKWKANVKADGRFHDTAVLSILKTDLTAQDANEENVKVWKLVRPNSVTPT